VATQQTLAQTVDAIAVINATVPGIVASYGANNMPQSITQTPSALVLLGPDEWKPFGITEFWIRVFVAPMQAAGNPGAIYARCLQLATDFRNTYALRTTNIGDRYIMRNKLTTKGGFGSTGYVYTLKYGNADYYGFQINLPLASSVPGA